MTRLSIRLTPPASVPAHIAQHDAHGLARKIDDLLQLYGCNETCSVRSEGVSIYVQVPAGAPIDAVAEVARAIKKGLDEPS